MTSQKCHITCSTKAILMAFQRFFRFIMHLCRRYTEWHQIKREHEALLRMQYRMRRDIGLSRSDIVRMIRDHKFWRYMLHPEEDGNEREPNRTEKAASDVEAIQDDSVSDFPLPSPDRSFCNN